jgi:hypothetical protein
MTLTKYERVVGVVVQPAEIHTVDGLTDLHTVTLQLPGMTTLYDPTDVDIARAIAELAALRQELAEVTQERNALDCQTHGESKQVEELTSQLAAALEHLHANDAALGLTGMESRPQAMYITDLNNQFAEAITARDEARDLATHAEFDRDHYELVKQQREELQGWRRKVLRYLQAKETVDALNIELEKYRSIIGIEEKP